LAFPANFGRGFGGWFTRAFIYKMNCPDSVKRGLHRIEVERLLKQLQSLSTRAEVPSPQQFYLTPSQILQFYSTGLLLIRSNHIWDETELKMLQTSVFFSRDYFKFTSRLKINFSGFKNG
jgi:hypothetical protein